MGDSATAKTLEALRLEGYEFMSYAFVLPVEPSSEVVDWLARELSAASPPARLKHNPVGGHAFRVLASDNGKPTVEYALIAEALAKKQEAAALFSACDALTPELKERAGTVY
jgi:hypothetical protein